jgi:voltage-gated potassium channel
MSAQQRGQVLHELQEWLEKPMLALSLVWLALLVVELIWGLNRALWLLGQAIWVAFIAEFALGLALAPERVHYLRSNWLKALALAAPALRLLRIARLARLARAGRGLRLLRVMTVLVTFAGAAGMYAFERDAPGGGFESFGAALWWTAMLLTSMGSEYWPRSADGRVLCLALAIYGFAVFGYVTATLATFFIGRDAADPDTGLGSAGELRALRKDLAALRARMNP